MNAKSFSAGKWLSMLKETFTEWSNDNVLRLSAALAYYSIFSIAPLLLITIGIASWVLHMKGAEGQITQQLSSIVGPNVAQAVQALLQSAAPHSKSATLIGFITLFIGASGVFGQLQDALNTIWEVKQKKGAGIWNMIRTRLLTFGMVLVIGFLLLVSLVIGTALAALNGWFQNQLGMPSFVTSALGFILPLAVEIALFAMIFKFLPDVEVAWKNVWMGAIVTAILFEIGKNLLSWYLGKGTTTSAFGAAGSVVLLLLWVYYASNIIFFGAEFTQVYAHATGSDIKPSAHAEPVMPHERAEQGMVAHSTYPMGSAQSQPHLLAPTSGVTQLQPEKESLLPLKLSGSIDAALEERKEIAEEYLAQGPLSPQEKIHAWVEKANEHPMAELGAALGFGLVAGLCMRLLDRRPDVSAAEHFRLGSKAAAVAGASALAGMGPWISKHIHPRAIKKAAQKTRNRLADLGEELPDRVQTAFR